MRRIAQTGTRAPKANRAIKEAKVKKAQRGGQFEDYSETNRYTGKGFPARFMSAAYEAQPFVKAKKAEDKRRAGLSEEAREIERINVQRAIDRAKASAGGNQRKGGKTIKRVAKAQNGRITAPKSRKSEYLDFKRSKTRYAKPSEVPQWVAMSKRAEAAEQKRRAGMTQEQRDLEKLNLERTRIQNEKDQQMRDRLNRGGGNQRRGGKTIKRVTKAQNGTKKETEAQRMQREADEKMKRWQTNRPDTLAPGDKAERAAWIYKKVQQAQQNAPKQKRGGVTRKAQTGAKTKAQMGVRTKAKYGTARKSSSRRSK